MLIEFTVGNFLSFKEKKTLSLLAATITDYSDTNLIETERRQLLKGAIIYGANSSGKSNLVKAMSTMRRLIKQNFERSSTDTLDITPFLLNSTTEIEPSFFEIIFLLKDIEYRYGFEVDNLAIRAEWLFEKKKATERPLFIRQGDGIEVYSRFKEGKDLEERTRNNVLFLNVVDQFNGSTAKNIMAWFTNFIVISGLSHERYKGVTFGILDDDKIKPRLQDFYNKLDLGFEDIRIDERVFDQDELPKELPDYLVKQLVTDLEGKTLVDVKTLHKKYNDKNKIIGEAEFDMRSQESSGTNKVFNISGPIFNVLTDGGVLVIDELDDSLHPLITLVISKLFNSKDHNQKNAQLVFATHDTNLLCYANYRRDQVYFVEKDKYGA